eukprot:4132840-Prymnesium_polylepis.1
MGVLPTSRVRVSTWGALGGWWQQGGESGQGQALRVTGLDLCSRLCTLHEGQTCAYCRRPVLARGARMCVLPPSRVRGVALTSRGRTWQTASRGRAARGPTSGRLDLMSSGPYASKAA